MNLYGFGLLTNFIKLNRVNTATSGGDDPSTFGICMEFRKYIVKIDGCWDYSISICSCMQKYRE